MLSSQSLLSVENSRKKLASAEETGQSTEDFSAISEILNIKELEDTVLLRAQLTSSTTTPAGSNKTVSDHCNTPKKTAH